MVSLRQRLVPRSEACEEDERCSPWTSGNWDWRMKGEGKRQAEGDSLVIRSNQSRGNKGRRN